MEGRERQKPILDGCEELEPCFVLCGSDPLAPILVRLWAGLAHLLGYPRGRIEGAEATAGAMREWRSRQR